MIKKISRRQFLKGAAITGVAMSLPAVPLKFWQGEAFAFYTSPALSKWNTVLRGVGPGGIPVALPVVNSAPVTGVDHYTIRAIEFKDRLYPADNINGKTFGKTTLWGYQPTKFLGGGTQTPRHLGGIIVAEKGRPIQITFQNELPPQAIIPIDTTLPGANQGPNRIAIHLHGGLIPWISDGGPFDWWDPNGNHGLSFLNNQILNPGAAANEAEYYYSMHLSARMLWYHDHAFGNTRLNAYAGLATALIIRDDFERMLVTSYGLPQFIELGGREIPIVFQDKIFVDNTTIKDVDKTWVKMGLPKSTGSLWYPHLYERNRWKLLGSGRNLPDPSCIPEMFGDTMLVNGTVYPEANVDPAPYRLRILNACNARFLNLQLYEDNGQPNGIDFDGSGNVTNGPGPDFFVLGTEGGFLPNAVSVPSNNPFTEDGYNFTGSLITGPAERWDLVVDFTGLEGKKFILYNDAPAPFPFGDDLYDWGSPANLPIPGKGPDTRQIMRISVSNTSVSATPFTMTDGTNLTSLSGTWNEPLLATVNTDGTYSLNGGVTVARTRKLSLNEAFDAYGRLAQQVGTDQGGQSTGSFGMRFLDPPTEDPVDGDVEIWEVYNLTGDSHPMHFHLVNLQILNREPIDPGAFPNFASAGAPWSPNPEEKGWKETVKMHPETVTRIIMKFALPQITASDGTTPIDLTSVGGTADGYPPASPRMASYGFNGAEYVYHCHILEHEEHDMMRPLLVKPKP